jgi:predicted ATPase
MRIHPVVEGAVAMIGASESRVIRTPDQRLRIFVSSTLKELGPERVAARAAIERLHLAPVMFELGARPHPPRELYRAYLDQSDVFVGIYWQQYGWVAPGEEVSGLEDEYRLAPREMPKLVYVKQSAQREERLGALVAHIRDDDTTSYKPFSTAEELGELVESDLAVLLAERFDASRARDALSETSDARADDAADHLPPSPDEVLGRETDLGTLLEWLGGGDPRRLVTLVGPGGIGKTRLAIEAARLARDRFDRVTFVALEHVREPGGVLPAVARELGVHDDIGVPTLERLALARSGRRDLLVLDNFEQVIGAAPGVASLLAGLPGATVMVTSRARLRVHAEQVFDVEPLALPIDPREVSLAEIADAPAVRLFLERAHAADPRFDLTAENAADVAGICRALDGVPLAIELAAACIRVLTPSAMLAKLDQVLSVLATSGRDAPERQRTVRATVEWSIDLLSASARALFVRLGVFTGDFSLDAVEAVAAGEPWAADLLGTLLELVDGSLLRQRDIAGTPLFSMLAPVRELAAFRFAHESDAPVVRRAHAAYYVRLASEVEPMLHGPTQQAAVERLAAERDNLRTGYLHFMAIGEIDTVTDAVWRLRLYWRIRNLLPTAKSWMDDLLQAGVPLAPRTRAMAITLSSWVSLSQPGTPVDPEPLEEAVELFRDVGDRFGEGAALAVLGVARATSPTPDLDRAEELQRRALDLVTPDVDPTFNAVFRGQLGSIQLLRGRAGDALAIYDGVIEDAVRMGNRFVEMIELTNAGWARLALGEARPELFARHLELTLRLGNEDGVGNALEGLAACAIVLGDLDRAGVLLGAVDMLRTRTGRFDQRTYPTSGPIVERVLASEGAAEFEAGRARGRAMSRRAALQFAREYAGRVAARVAAGAGARTDAPGSGSPEHPQFDS